MYNFIGKDVIYKPFLFALFCLLFFCYFDFLFNVLNNKNKKNYICFLTRSIHIPAPTVEPESRIANLHN